VYHPWKATSATRLAPAFWQRCHRGLKAQIFNWNHNPNIVLGQTYPVSLLQIARRTICCRRLTNFAQTFELPERAQLGLDAELRHPLFLVTAMPTAGEEALLAELAKDEVDPDIVRQICAEHGVPPELRGRVWQVIFY